MCLNIQQINTSLPSNGQVGSRLRVLSSSTPRQPDSPRRIGIAAPSTRASGTLTSTAKSTQHCSVEKDIGHVTSRPFSWPTGYLNCSGVERPVLPINTHQVPIIILNSVRSLFSSPVDPEWIPLSWCSIKPLTKLNKPIEKLDLCRARPRLGTLCFRFSLVLQLSGSGQPQERLLGQPGGQAGTSSTDTPLV